MHYLRSPDQGRLTCSVILALLFVGMVSGVVIAEDESIPGQQKLIWVNGDELTGRIVESTDTHLLWQSEALSQALSVDLRTLHSVVADKTEQANDAVSAFRVRLVNGDTWIGDLKSISDEYAVLTGSRYGEVSVKRAWINRIIRKGLTAPIDLTGTKAEGWVSVSPSWEQKEELTQWNTDNPEEITTSNPGARLFHPTVLPELCDIE
ncbi:MAG: hypothetical protein KDA52_15200, partial [Planctomycetaceae bacterium]|nr:hypothetical protein [Planctomycetaceae bacterium]